MTNTDDGTDGAPRRVLYVDSEDDGTVDQLAEHVTDGIRPEFVATDDATAAADATAWDCLVLTACVEPSVCHALLDRTSCPSVLFTGVDPSEVSSATLDRVDTLVQRSEGTSVAFLAAKVETLLEPAPDVADARSRALSTVEAEAVGGTALFLVGDDGRVRWANRSFEDVFPDIRGEAVPSPTEDFEAALDALAPDRDGTGLFRIEDPDAAVDGDTPMGTGGVRYYVHERHRPDGLGDGVTIEQFEEVTDRVDREIRHHQLASLTEEARDGLYALDRNGVVEFCNESFADMLGYEREAVIGRHAAELLVPGELARGQQTVQSLLEDPEAESTQIDMAFRTRAGDERELSIHYALLPALDDSYGGLMGVARDVTDRRERERQIEAQRDELSALSRTNVLLREIIGALAGATDRSALQQTVCDRLVESGRYSLAWIGERRGANDVLVPLASAGDGTGYLEDVEIRTDESPAGMGPGGRAYCSGEVQVVRDVREAEQFDPWRERALSAGFESLVVAPLGHGERVDGILAVYATEPDAFSPRVERGFAVLGEMTGLALTAVRNRRLLQREETLRLEFRSESEDACLTWLARACSCTLETAGVVETGDGVIQYLRIEGAEPSGVVAAIRDGPAEYDAAVTRSEGDSLVEIHGSSSLATDLTEVGARLVDSGIGADGSRFVVETTGDGDVRAIQNVVERWNPDVRLVSKTNHDQHEGEAAHSPLSTLTDRQREVLRAAYLSGYYDWPRETTAEELADSLGIASPTLHQHLRRAESNLLSELLDH